MASSIQQRVFHGKKFAKALIAKDVVDRLDEERAREVFGDGKK